MTASFKTIRRYPDTTLARLAASKLESQGIEAFVADENMVSMGVRLQVRAREAEVASEILGEAAEISEEDLTQEALDAAPAEVLRLPQKNPRK